jgi:hypothetical protein
MFDMKNKYHYIFAFGVILISSYIGNSFKKNFEPNYDNDYKLVQEYLLNDSPMYGFNKPKLWIHSKYELNARKWKSFQSRNTKDLNEPYIHLCIKTIINHCGDDFHICLIDDNTFSKLIPSWDVDVMNLPNPTKSRVRELGMAQLLYIYGGMVVPNSFICTRNLKEMYDTGVAGNLPFICENVNRSCYLQKKTNELQFVPDPFFMGSNKNNDCINNYIQYLTHRNSYPHMNNEVEFLDETADFFLECIWNHQIHLVDGCYIGVKTMGRKMVLLEDLMEEDYLDLVESKYGVYIPHDELLARTKYNWFAVLPSNEILQTNMFVSKLLIASIVDTNPEYQKIHNKKEIPSVMSI